MKNSTMLTIVALLNFFLLTGHIAGDIVYGWEPGKLTNLVVTVLVSGVWISAAILLAGRRSGYIILLVGSLLGLFVPYVHMSGVKGVGVASRLAGHQGHLLFVWSLLTIAELSLFSVILCVRGLWSLPWRKSR